MRDIAGETKREMVAHCGGVGEQLRIHATISWDYRRNAHVSAYVCMHVCKNIYIYRYMCVYVCMNMYVYIYIYIYI